MTVGPEPPMAPTFCFSFGNRSLTPRITFQAMLPVLALMA